MNNSGQLNANATVEVFSKSMGDHDPSTKMESMFCHSRVSRNTKFEVATVRWGQMGLTEEGGDLS